MPMIIRPAITVAITLALFAAAAAPCAAADEFHMRQEGGVNVYNVYGNVERSFYPKHKTRYYYENEADFTKDAGGGNTLYGDFFWRATDDRLLDPQDGFSVEKVYVGIKNENADAILGDFYAAFTDYTVTNALKGLKLELMKPGKFRLISVGGIDTPRWEDLWENRTEDGAARRYVWGQRMENFYFDDKLQVNYNYGGAWDDWATFSEGVPPLYVQVGSVDWKIQLYRELAFRGEWAISYSDEDSRWSEVDPKTDRAYKFGLDYADERYEFAAEYSRIGPHFNTTGGFTARDLESWLYDGTVYLPLDMTLAHYLHIDRDNLNKARETTTRQINPGAKLSFRLPRSWKADLGYDMTRSVSTDTLAGQLTNIYTAGLAKEFDWCYFSAQYTHTVVEDYKNAEQDRVRDGALIGMDGDLTLANVRFFWNVGEDITVEQYPKVGGCKQDFLITHSGGLKAVFPSSLTFEGKVSFNDNNYYLNPSDSNVNKYRFAVSRILPKDLTASFAYEQNEYYYAGGDNNYIEMLMFGKLACKF